MMLKVYSIHFSELSNALNNGCVCWKQVAATDFTFSVHGCFKEI